MQPAYAKSNKNSQSKTDVGVAGCARYNGRMEFGSLVLMATMRMKPAPRGFARAPAEFNDNPGVPSSPVTHKCANTWLLME